MSMTTRSLYVPPVKPNARSVCVDPDHKQGGKQKLMPPRIRPLCRADDQTGVAAFTAQSVFVMA